MSGTSLGFYICIGLLTILIPLLVIPRTRRKIFSWLDSLETEPKTSFTPPPESSPKPSKTKPLPINKTKLDELIQQLNEKKPKLKEDIKKEFVQIYGNKISPFITEGNKHIDDYFWSIQFYPPGRGQNNVQIIQATDKEWKIKKKQ